MTIRNKSAADRPDGRHAFAKPQRHVAVALALPLISEWEPSPSGSSTRAATARGLTRGIPATGQ